MTQIHHRFASLMEKCQAKQVRWCHHPKLLLTIRKKEGTASLALSKKTANSADAEGSTEQDRGEQSGV